LITKYCSKSRVGETNPGTRLDFSAIRGSANRRSRFLTATSILALSVALVAACGTAATAPTSSDQSAEPELISVVASTAVLADLVRQVGGNRVSIYNLVPPGSDVHTYQFTPLDNVEVSQASLIVSNGAGLFVSLDRLIRGSASPDAVQVVASDGLTPSRMNESPFPSTRHDDDGHDDDDGQVHLRGDPHFWLDPHFAVHYVNQIANGLVATDPVNAQEYLDNAAEYISQLEALDAYISAKIAEIPSSRRVLVTFHDAYGYFGSRYGFEVQAFVGSHGGDVAPDDIVAVLDLVGDRNLPAVFSEPQFSADALAQVAHDAGISVGIIRSTLDVDYATYLEMMRANADALAANLR
jgi:manganese/iron transport system substrate-binding protein